MIVTNPPSIRMSPLERNRSCGSESITAAGSQARPKTSNASLTSPHRYHIRLNDSTLTIQGNRGKQTLKPPYEHGHHNASNSHVALSRSLGNRSLFFPDCFPSSSAANNWQSHISSISYSGYLLKRSNHPFQQNETCEQSKPEHQQFVGNNFGNASFSERVDNNFRIGNQNTFKHEPESIFNTPTSSQLGEFSADNSDDDVECAVDDQENVFESNLDSTVALPLHIGATTEQNHMPLPSVMSPNLSSAAQAVSGPTSADAGLDENIDVAMQFAATLLEFSWQNWSKRLEKAENTKGSNPEKASKSKEINNPGSVAIHQDMQQSLWPSMRSFSGSSFSNVKLSEESSPVITPTRSKPIKMKIKNGGNASIITQNPESQEASLRAASTCNEISNIKHQSDYVDPADGHIWRAKYCVLQGKCLFFYPNEFVAMLEDAIIERQRWESDCHRLGQNETNDRKSIGVDSRHLNRHGNPTTKKALLSQSPMPRYNVINLGLTCSTIDYGSDGNIDANPSSQFYEKVVPLECVGSVRSTELHYGRNSFELSAVRDDDDDKLVLRAQNKEEMSEWLFQFHRAIASFVRDMMDQLVPHSSGDIHHHVFQHKSLAVPQLPLRTTSKVDITGTPIPSSESNSTIPIPMTAVTVSITTNTPSTVEWMATPAMDASPSRSASSYSNANFSPRHHKMLCGASSSFSSNASHALSHGHGRSSMHRRRGCGSSSVASSVTSSVVAPTLDGISSGKSLHDDPQSVLQPPIPFPFSEQDCDMMLGAPSPRNLDLELEVASDVSRPLMVPDLRSSANPKSQLSKGSGGGKYVPPHLRNKNSIPNERAKKYVPPHLRVRKEDPNCIQETKDRDPSSPTQDLGCMLEPTYIPRNVRRNDKVPVPPNSRDSFENPSVSSLDKTGLPISNDDRDSSFIMKLGGCADPLHTTGSILDRRYIPLTASKLEKVRSVPHGHFSEQSPSHCTTSSLRWEIGAISECGIRETNQDSFLVTSNLVRMFEQLDTADSPAPSQSTVWDQCGVVHPPGLFAIFDGHCGDHASRFAAERISDFIRLESVLAVDDATDSQVTKAVEVILDRAIRKLDDAFCNLCVEDDREWESGSTALVAALVNEHLVIANLGDSRGLLGRSVPEQHVTDHIEQGWNLLPPEEYHDSGKKCLWKNVTNIHSPGQESERERIAKANGWVTTEQEIPVCQLRRMVLLDDDVVDILKRCFASQYCLNEPEALPTKASAPQRILQISRLCGELAVSRALGDRDFKASFHPQVPDVAPHNVFLRNPDISEAIAWKSSMCLPYPSDHNGTFVGDLVSNIPDFHTVRIGQDYVNDEFLLLACDGLWDVIDADDAYRVSRDLLFNKKWTAKKTAARLAELAVHLGSSDNITVIVIRFFHNREK